VAEPGASLLFLYPVKCGRKNQGTTERAIRGTAFRAGRGFQGLPAPHGGIEILSTKTAPSKTGGALFFAYSNPYSADDAVLLHHFAEFLDHIGSHRGEFVGGGAVTFNLMNLGFNIIGSLYHYGRIVDLIFNAKHNYGLPVLL
jgi:hypothetical protein